MVSDPSSSTKKEKEKEKKRSVCDAKFKVFAWESSGWPTLILAWLPALSNVSYIWK